MKRRVVITGTGVISPLDNHTVTLWNNIKHGKSGIKRMSSHEIMYQTKRKKERLKSHANRFSFGGHNAVYVFKKWHP